MTCLLQVYIGPYRPTHELVSRVTDTTALVEGDLVAINCDWEGEPAIGECLHLKGEEVSIKWKTGTYTSAWIDAKVLDPEDKRRRIDWVQDVPISSVILFAFKLTNKNHLRKSTISHLKEAYSQLRA